jgi:hypothetical protein
MDASDKAQAIAALKQIGRLPDQGEVISDPLTRAGTLIEKLDEALRRTLSTANVCPYCDTPTYLRRHNAGCGISQVLDEAKGWLEGRW